MNGLYDLLKKYKSLTYYTGASNTGMCFTNTYDFVERDRFGHIILSSEDNGSVCTIDSDTPYMIHTLPFNRDLLTLFDRNGVPFHFNAKKI